MKKNYTILILLLSNLISGYAQTSIPKIRDFNPKSGPIGTIVTVKGNNFSSQINENIVIINGIKSKVISTNDSLISFIIPKGVSFSRINLTVNGLNCESNLYFKSTNNSVNCKNKIYFNKIETPNNNYSTEFLSFDFNKDSILDIVTANYSNNTISYYQGIGDGSFKTKKEFNAGIKPFTLALGDFNKDNNTDIIVGNFESNTSVFTILQGDNKGNFIKQNDITQKGFSGTISIKTNDLNNDGNLDIISVDYYSNAFSVYLGNGDGTFKNKINNETSYSVSSISIGDFNNDGFLDIASGNSFNLDIFEGNGDGTFKPKVFYSADANLTDLLNGDFNNDGYLDLIAANNGKKDISIFLNNGLGGFSNKQNFNINSPATINKFAILDVDGDGNLDITTNNFSSNWISVLLGYGDGTFGSPTLINSNNNSNAILSGDFDLDGKHDIITLGSNGLFVFLNKYKDPSCDINVESDTIFSNQNTNLIFEFEGKAPFSLTLNDGKKDSIISNINTNVYFLNIKPKNTTTYSLKSISDSLDCSSYKIIDNKITIYVQDTLVGIENNVFHSNEIEIYPNPVISDNKINISSKNIDLLNNSKIIIYDNLSKEIPSINYHINQTNGILEITFYEKFPIGLYSIKINSNNFSIIKKILFM